MSEPQWQIPCGCCGHDTDDSRCKYPQLESDLAKVKQEYATKFLDQNELIIELNQAVLTARQEKNEAN